MKTHQPDLFMSCNLRKLTAIPGKKVAINEIDVIGPKYLSYDQTLSPANAASRIGVHRLNMNIKRQKYQNSDLDALPENVAYLTKQVLIDSTKFMCNLFLGFSGMRKNLTSSCNF